ncbi:MAG: alpha/beta fold hydrolase, partial [Acetobacteraceae bacterium]|nr:alpha/beta fold hydrolase [Acetobacteraceae bacterium]
MFPVRAVMRAILAFYGGILRREPMTTDPINAMSTPFTEHRIPRDRGSVHVRDFVGSGAAFVLLHGFPDNSHIYDDLIPHLVSAGRRTVTIDFLGFGSSDKPEGAAYSFAQQLGDVEAVVDALKLEKVVPVGHDAGGPAAVNFALKHPERAA